jgi:hypothetical protein
MTDPIGSSLAPPSAVDSISVKGFNDFSTAGAQTSTQLGVSGGADARTEIGAVLGNKHPVAQGGLTGTNVSPATQPRAEGHVAVQSGSSPVNAGQTVTGGGAPTTPNFAHNFGQSNLGSTGMSWYAASAMAQSNAAQSFSSFSPFLASSFVTLYLSEPDTLREAFSNAVRRSNGHNNNHPTHQQQPSQLVANVFHQLNQQNRLALTSSPVNSRGGSGPTELLNEVDRTAFTRMVAASMRDFSARAATGSINQLDGQSLHPQSVLAAFGLTHADQLGPDWLAHGTTQLITLAQGAGPQEADVILEALSLALLMSALVSLKLPTGARSELALAQTFAAMQLISQMQDPDAFAQMFSRLGPGERQQLLTLLASLSPNVKLPGLDELDPISLLFKAFAARSGEGRLGEGQRSAGAGIGENLGTLLSARSAAGMGARGDTVATEKLRAEILQFVAAQPASFYFAETANQKNFHSGRLEAVLQLIVQQLLMELAAKAGRLSKLRCDFADSIELLSNLLDLLTQRDDEDSEHSRRGENEEPDEDENSETDIDIAGSGFAARAHFGDRLSRVEPRGGMTAEYSCQTLFRVVPDQVTPSKVAFRWEKFERSPLIDLPDRLAPKSSAEIELKQLHRYASASSVVLNADTDADAGLKSHELLTELLVPNDAAYALGASAAGTSIMAKHWHCKMWAHDLTYRLSAEELANHKGENARSGDNASKQAFDFGAYLQQDVVPLANNDDASLNIAIGADLKPLRSETAMRHDLLRMLENSQDRWVREQASRALQSGLQKLRATGDSSVEAKGEVVRRLRSPALRDCTIYFLSRYYFTLNSRDALH